MFLLFTLTSCLQQNFTHIANTIKTLHEKTKYSTFYEMFNIPEHANLEAIQSAFRKQLRTTKDEKLLFDAYNILSKDRATLDYYLKHNSFPEIKGSKFGFVLFMIFLVICADLVYMVYRINNQKQTRRKKGKSYVSVKEMYSYKFIMMIKDKIYG